MSKTLAKALSLLTLLKQHQYLSLNELSEKSNMPKSTTHRMLKTLEELRYVKRVKEQKEQFEEGSHYYTLGLECLELGAAMMNNVEVRDIALPYMKQLRDRFGESVQLVMLDHDEALYIDKVESKQEVRLYTKIGRRAPLHAGACPRVLLSFLKDEQVEKLLSKPLQQVTAFTVVNPEEVWKNIIKTREQGYTHSVSELLEDTAAVGVPIFDRYGEVLASLSIAGPKHRFKEEHVAGYVEAMWEVCASISKALGYAQPYPYPKHTNIWEGLQ
jgi:IclR family KDG regulon transcriptional repressor